MNKITTWAQYVELAVRTAKPLEFNDQIDHARLGMAAEIGELMDVNKRATIYGKPFDTVNFMEEVGDLCWYIALEAHTKKLALQVPDPSPSESLTMSRPIMWRVFRTVSALSNSSHDGNSTMALELMLYALMTLCRIHEVDFYDCLGRNIAKLAKRYGDKYSDQAALVRDLISERETLEGK